MALEVAVGILPCFFFFFIGLSLLSPPPSVSAWWIFSFFTVLILRPNSTLPSLSAGLHRRYFESTRVGKFLLHASKAALSTGACDLCRPYTRT